MQRKPADQNQEKAENQGRITDLFSIERSERRVKSDKRVNSHNRRTGRWMTTATEDLKDLEIGRLRNDLYELILGSHARVCDQIACNAAIVRRDSGARVCSLGHRVRWVEVQELDDANTRIIELEKACKMALELTLEYARPGDELGYEFSNRVTIALRKVLDGKKA